MTNVSSYKFLSTFSNLLILAACHRLLIIFTDEVLCLYTALICTEDVLSSHCISLFVLKIDVPDLYCTSLLLLGGGGGGGGTKAPENPS